MVVKEWCKKLNECKSNLVTIESLASLLNCSAKEARSLMFLTDNVFCNEKRSGNCLVAKRKEVLKVVMKLLEEGRMEVPEKRRLEYPRNLLCILFCGEVPARLTEKECLAAISQGSQKSQEFLEGFYRDRKSKRQLQKQLGITVAELFLLEQDSLSCLKRRLTRKEIGVVSRSVQELPLSQTIKNVLLRAGYFWEEDLIRVYQEDRKKLKELQRIGPKSWKEIKALLEQELGGVRDVCS